MHAYMSMTLCVRKGACARGDTVNDLEWLGPLQRLSRQTLSPDWSKRFFCEDCPRQLILSVENVERGKTNKTRRKERKGTKICVAVFVAVFVWRKQNELSSLKGGENEEEEENEIRLSHPSFSFSAKRKEKENEKK